jgi:hypothetical protein
MSKAFTPRPCLACREPFTPQSPRDGHCQKPGCQTARAELKRRQRQAQGQRHHTRHYVRVANRRCTAVMKHRQRCQRQDVQCQFFMTCVKNFRQA